MSGKSREIKNAIRNLVSNDTKSNLFVCTVTSYDINSKTCEADAIVGDTVVGIPKRLATRS